MRRAVAILMLLVVLGGLGACTLTSQPQAEEPVQTVPTPLPALSGGIGVLAEGRVLPATTVNLLFEISGTVAEVLVKEGDRVVAGQPLARLDARELALRVEQAQATLEQAQAEYERLLEGATPEQIAAARAELARMQGQLRAVQAAVSESDIAAARAELESARERLRQLEAGPRPAEVRAAQAAVDEARANLQLQRDRLSQAKTDAELRVEIAANALRNAQDTYSRIYWRNRGLELDRATELAAGFREEEAAAARAVADAETALEQARLAYEQAKLAEQSGIEIAEAQLRNAEARYDQLVNPANADAIAAARAAVAAAQARLDSLAGNRRAGDIDAAQAAVDNAQARLAELQATPTDATISTFAARIRNAEVGLKQAQLAFERATLTAPISGVVAEVNLKVGEVPVPTLPAIVVADMSNWKIETEDLTEISIVRIREGDPVTLTFDALPGFELPGKVTQIKPRGQNRQGEVVYTVVVVPDRWDERLRWNMTANVRIAND
ncbi:MAG: biotin/lipoyl-binding protein [Oscillochloridaceae bacterium]|nr:biotin/lipoyl-binding protein [Chloroflexaceae bacterium]MDW8389302.1 biotin/lipoyl-binding protein [Oscillochloridaceae bacterium]